MMAGIETYFFEGGCAGKNLKYSITDYQTDNFRMAGEIIAVSITQDGPPPNFFSEWIYKYIYMGEIERDQLSKGDVTDQDLLELINQVEAADSATLIDLSEKILACGYTGLLMTDKKESIISAIVLHSCVRVLPMLQQMCTGLELYRLHDMIKERPAIFQQLFVPGQLDKPDADFLVMALSPVLSEPGSLKRNREFRIINFLQDFIQSLGDEEETGNDNAQPDEMEDKAEMESDRGKINICSLMQWLTGQAHVPITSAEGANFKIKIEFQHECQAQYGQHVVCYPIVNACSNSITFPTMHTSTYHEFVDFIKKALTNSGDFGHC